MSTRLLLYQCKLPLKRLQAVTSKNTILRDEKMQKKINKKLIVLFKVISDTPPMKKLKKYIFLLKRHLIFCGDWLGQIKKNYFINLQLLKYVNFYRMSPQTTCKKL